MDTHKKENFEGFMSQLLETNANLPFYTDFEKCNANVKKETMPDCDLPF